VDAEGAFAHAADLAGLVSVDEGSSTLRKEGDIMRVRSRTASGLASGDKSARLIAAAVASVALAGAAAQSANAGLMIDLRAVSSNVPGDTVTPKLVTAHYGSVITFEIVARLTGTNATQLVGNFDNAAPATDTKNDEALQIVSGSFRSIGALLGDFDPSNQGMDPHVQPFAAPGSQNGTQSDWDSDGDLDIGNGGTDVTNMWAVRAGSRQFATVSKQSGAPQTRFGYSSDSPPFQQDFGGPNGSPPATNVITPTTSEMLIGELAFTVLGTTGSTNLTYVPRPLNEAGAALWWEDGVATNVMPNPGVNYTAGAPIVVQIPEPASAGLLGLASLGLLARRKK
jgi:hypothetical protein